MISVVVNFLFVQKLVVVNEHFHKGSKNKHCFIGSDNRGKLYIQIIYEFSSSLQITKIERIIRIKF